MLVVCCTAVQDKQFYYFILKKWNFKLDEYLPINPFIGNYSSYVDKILIGNYPQYDLKIHFLSRNIGIQASHFF